MIMIVNLYKQIDKANEMLGEYNAILSKDADNLACQLSVETIKNHIADLHRQIKEENGHNN